MYAAESGNTSHDEFTSFTLIEFGTKLIPTGILSDTLTPVNAPRGELTVSVYVTTSPSAIDGFSPGAPSSLPAGSALFSIEYG